MKKPTTHFSYHLWTCVENASTSGTEFGENEKKTVTEESHFYRIVVDLLYFLANSYAIYEIGY